MDNIKEKKERNANEMHITLGDHAIIITLY